MDGIIKYSVANMQRAVGRTSTIALGNATTPFIIALSNEGRQKVCTDEEHLLNGLNVHTDKVIHNAIREASGIKAITSDLFLRPEYKKCGHYMCCQSHKFCIFGGSDENSLQTRLIKTLNLLEAFRDSISSSVIN